MDNRNSNESQPESDQPLTPNPVPRRRKRTFPVHFRVRMDERGTPIDSEMYYAHEWEELLRQEAAAEQARKEAEDAARAAREAELAAGRPSAPDRGHMSGADQAYDPAAGEEPDHPDYPMSAAQTSARRAALVASTPVIHSIDRIPPDYDRHSRLCSICDHPDRDAIEGDFVRWRKPSAIIEDYGVSSRSALYRHAHATGLFQLRSVELARVLETRLEEAEDCPLEQFDVITRAVRAYAHLGDDGRWFEPTRVHHVLTGPLPETASNSLPPGAAPPDPPFDISVNLPNPR